MTINEIQPYRDEIHNFFTQKNLPFWLDRCMDSENGGYITHFDKDGNDSFTDEKSLISQSRTVYSMSAAARAGYFPEKCSKYAEHGVDFLINTLWDKEHGGFFWMSDRAGNITIDKKVVYGQSFAIYALCEYSLATGDDRGREYASIVFDLLQKYAVDSMYGGYLEMFEQNWDLSDSGSAGGDRKTLDVHMHLMESFTRLYECTGKSIHRRKLKEVIDLSLTRMLHPQYRTGVPQFFQNWDVAPQIKFDIIWGWDRFEDSGFKPNATDNTAPGHNAEFAWLLIHALSIMQEDISPYKRDIEKLLAHTVNYGVDYSYGGIFVECSHSGAVSDEEKEFWQQLEAMIGLLDGYLLSKEDRFWDAYKNVHRFVFDKTANHTIGEFWPLLTRKGDPIWTHMGHSWKTSYHSIRSMIQCIERLDKITVI